MVPPEISYVIGQFEKKGVNASSDWIKACIDWCKSEIPQACRSNQSIMTNVFSQWLDTDIRADGIQSGPQIQISTFHLDKLKPPQPIKRSFILQLMGYVFIAENGYYCEFFDYVINYI